MERHSTAARLRFFLKRTADNVRDQQDLRANMSDSSTDTDHGLTALQTTSADRRLVLLATGLLLSGCGRGESKTPTGGIEPGRYPPRTRAVETTAATGTATETTPPTAETTFSETEFESCIRGQAKCVAQLTLDAYKNPPYASFPEREAHGENAGTYTVPLNSGWVRHKDNSSEYHFYVLEATVTETTDSNSQTQPVVGNLPWQISIGRQIGHTPKEIIDQYTLTHVGDGNWCLTSTRRVTVNKKHHLETINYYTDPQDGQNAFDDNAQHDLEVMNALLAESKRVKDIPIEEPFHERKPYSIPKFSPRE